VTYGADMVMQMYTPGLYDEPASGVPNAWSTDILLPGSAQIQYIHHVLRDRSPSGVAARVPAQELVLDDLGTNDQAVKAVRSEGAEEWIVVYLPSARNITVAVEGLNRRGYAAKWFDPVNGGYSQIVNYGSGSGSTREFSTPATSQDHEDWVLVLE